MVQFSFFTEKLEYLSEYVNNFIDIFEDAYETMQSSKAELERVSEECEDLVVQLIEKQDELPTKQEVHTAFVNIKKMKQLEEQRKQANQEAARRYRLRQKEKMK